jgi:hypothetical protein
VLDGDLRVVDGASAGGWIKSRLDGEFATVTSVVPRGFEAYARIFHPADALGQPVSWAEVAAKVGATPHREMQWEAIVGPPDPSGSRWPSGDPLLGTMDIPTLDALCEVLAAHTVNPSDCFFGLCTIENWKDSFSTDELDQPYLQLPLDRDHIVLAGPLATVEQITFDWGSGEMSVTFTSEDGPPPDPDPAELRKRAAPNLIWPGDRSWLVASEVDYDSTLVGGPTKLIQTILDSPKLEAWEVEPTDSLAADADRINSSRPRA